jgi:hypothetical protein
LDVSGSCCCFLSDLLFVAINPGIEIGFVEAPAFVETNLPESIAHHLLLKLSRVRPQYSAASSRLKMRFAAALPFRDSFKRFANASAIQSN